MRRATIDEFLMARYAEESAAGGDKAAIDSKNRILLRCQETLMMFGSPALTHFVKQTLLDLARAYEQHPDYRGDDWKWEMR